MIIDRSEHLGGKSKVMSTLYKPLQTTLGRLLFIVWVQFLDVALKAVVWYDEGHG